MEQGPIEIQYQLLVDRDYETLFQDHKISEDSPAWKDAQGIPREIVERSITSLAFGIIQMTVERHIGIFADSHPISFHLTPEELVTILPPGATQEEAQELLANDAEKLSSILSTDAQLKGAVHEHIRVRISEEFAHMLEKYQNAQRFLEAREFFDRNYDILVASEGGRNEIDPDEKIQLERQIAIMNLYLNIVRDCAGVLRKSYKVAAQHSALYAFARFFHLAETELTNTFPDLDRDRFSAYYPRMILDFTGLGLNFPHSVTYYNPDVMDEVARGVLETYRELLFYTQQNYDGEIYAAEENPLVSAVGASAFHIFISRADGK